MVSSSQRQGGEADTSRLQATQTWVTWEHSYGGTLSALGEGDVQCFAANRYKYTTDVCVCTRRVSHWPSVWFVGVYNEVVRCVEVVPA